MKKKDNNTPMRAHCSFCGGRGIDMQIEIVKSPLGTHYRIPLDHAACKQSVLSLSLSLSLLTPPLPSPTSGEGKG